MRFPVFTHDYWLNRNGHGKRVAYSRRSTYEARIDPASLGLPGTLVFVSHIPGGELYVLKPLPPATNTPPTYHASPYFYPGTQNRKEHHFGVYETRDGKTSLCFILDNRGDRMQELLKRGIPADQAKTVFYQMDGN